MPTAEPAIEAVGLRKRFGRQRVLDGVDLAIPDGRITVVLGPSGTGKSVLIRHIIGLLKPDAGSIHVDGLELDGMSRSGLIGLRRRIGVMFQDGALFTSMTVLDNVAFPLRQHTDLSEAAIREVALQRLADVGLQEAGGKYPAQLSGGMRKRAGLARSLVLNPRILLCDEPDSGLDPVRTALLGDLLLDRHRRVGGTVVVVTHNVGLAKALADHVAILWQGRILAAGDAEPMWRSPDPFVRQFLAGAPDGPLGMD